MMNFELMDFSELSKLAGGYVEARAIQAALEIGVFEALRDSKDASGVAGAIRCDPRATELLLNALVSIGLLTKQQSVYSLNDAASTYLWAPLKTPKHFQILENSF